MSFGYAHLSAPIKGYPSHYHDDWEVIAVMEGELTTWIDGEAHRTARGDVLILPPKTQHRGKSEGVFVDLFFRTDNLPYSKPLILHDYNEWIRTLMNLLYKASVEGGSGYETICDSLLKCIITYINRLTRDTCKHPVINAVCAKIAKNISNPDFDITKTIEKMGYHPDYVRRIFREELKTTPLQYMTWLRLTQAQRLLVNELYLTVETVALQCGFADSFYFSTVFRKHFGISPRNYRKEHSSKTPL